MNLHDADVWHKFYNVWVFRFFYTLSLFLDTEHRSQKQWRHVFVSQAEWKENPSISMNEWKKLHHTTYEPVYTKRNIK